MNGRLEPGGLALIIGPVSGDKSIVGRVVACDERAVSGEGRVTFPSGIWASAPEQEVAVYWRVTEAGGDTYCLWETSLMPLNGGDEEQTAESDGLPMVVAN